MLQVGAGCRSGSGGGVKVQVDYSISAFGVCLKKTVSELARSLDVGRYRDISLGVVRKFGWWVGWFTGRIRFCSHVVGACNDAG